MGVVAETSVLIKFDVFSTLTSYNCIRFNRTGRVLPRNLYNIEKRPLFINTQIFGRCNSYMLRTFTNGTNIWL